jgi:hypothetical protein
MSYSGSLEFIKMSFLIPSYSTSSRFLDNVFSQPYQNETKQNNKTNTTITKPFPTSCLLSRSSFVGSFPSWVSMATIFLKRHFYPFLLLGFRLWCLFYIPKPTTWPPDSPSIPQSLLGLAGTPHPLP